MSGLRIASVEDSENGSPSGLGENSQPKVLVLGLENSSSNSNSSHTSGSSKSIPAILGKRKRKAEMMHCYEDMVSSDFNLHLIYFKITVVD